MKIYNLTELDSEIARRKAEIAIAPRGIGPNGNELRFTIKLAHVYPMLADGAASLPQIVEAVRAAIVEAINSTLGAGLDGTPIPGRPIIVEQLPEGRLYAELIEFDLS